MTNGKSSLSACRRSNCDMSTHVSVLVSKQAGTPPPRVQADAIISCTAWCPVPSCTVVLFDEVTPRYLQLSCFPSKGIQSLHIDEKMTLTNILLQRIARKLMVFTSWPRIHTGDERCRYRYYIPCSTIHGTNLCYPTMLMTFGTALIIQSWDSVCMIAYRGECDLFYRCTHGWVLQPQQTH
jgi:hypothetical protein